MAKNILICDDAAYMRMMLKTILTRNGYNVVGEAANGIEGVEKVKELKPDLVMLDITMPEMDGIGALKEIKKMNLETEIIMCVSLGQKAIVKEAIVAGAKTFVFKPFSEDRVLEAVKSVIG